MSIDFLDFAGGNVFSSIVALQPKGTVRLDKIALPADLYGTVNIQASGGGLVVRNYVVREDTYTLPFGGE